MPDVLQEIDASNQFHREEPQLILTEQLVELDQIGMADINECAEFALESIQEGRIRPSQNLQGDQLLLVAVVALVDLAEATFAEPAAHLEPPAARKLSKVQNSCVGRTTGWVRYGLVEEVGIRDHGATHLETLFVDLSKESQSLIAQRDVSL
jgi:hypothetical protein